MSIIRDGYNDNELLQITNQIREYNDCIAVLPQQDEWFRWYESDEPEEKLPLKIRKQIDRIDRALHCAT